MELTPGIWIYRYEIRTWHDSRVFDTNSDIPITAVQREIIRYPHNPQPAWYDEAACIGMDDSIFFGSDTFAKGPPLSLNQLRLARAVCDACPVARECLTHALTTPEQYGIWAGTSGNMREKMIKQINAGAQLHKVIEDYLES